VGRIVLGPEALPGDLDGGPIKLEAMFDRFSMRFTRKLGLVPESFPPVAIAQIEFSAKVPWVLSEPCTE
jgi:hypothetical protein